MEYMYADALRSEIPYTLSDDDQTKITEHADENPRMSTHHVGHELGLKLEMVRTTLKKKGISHY